MILRAVGESDVSAHSIGYDVIRVRYLAVLFGGAMAGLGGAFLSLVLHADVGRGDDRRARLDRAGAGGVRVLAAVAAAARRLSVRRRHHPAALCPGRRPFGVPSQVMSMLPYLATIVVLAVIAGGPWKGRLDAPACLGKPFRPAT